MLKAKINAPSVPDIAQGGNLSIAAESFLVDRKAGGLAKNTIMFYRNYLKAFLAYCDGLSITHIQEINADFLRRYLLSLEGKHNPGGIHGAYRTLSAFFHWLDFEEVMDSAWKNPILKVKAPKVAREPIEPIPLEDIDALIKTCTNEDKTGIRDKAIFLCLLDTGARAQEFCNINISDVDFTTGSILIKMGKGRKPRIVFFREKIEKSCKGISAFTKG